MGSNFTIVSCTADQRADALRVLHAGLPSDQQMALVHALQTVDRQDPSTFAGLLVPKDASGEFVGACWVQLTAGQTAVVWLPPADCAAAADLMRAMSDFLDARRVVLAQFLASEESSVDTELLVVADFQKLARLAYLAIDKPLCPSKQPDGPLSFRPHAAEESQRLGELLQRTYEGSYDCPRLNGVRSPADVIEGYRQQGTFASERWFFVQRDGHDVGTLILTSHEDSGNWELVYMALVPAARGAGLGKQILEFAMWQAASAGAERLVLAVDEANPYALEMYQRAGFVAWDYRTVYARLRPQA